MWRISWLAENVFASQQGLCSTELVSPPTPVALRPDACHDLLILEAYRSHTTHHSR